MPQDSNPWGQPLGAAVPGWTPPPHPVPSTMQGRFCRLDPLGLKRHAADLYAAYALDADGRNWTYLPYGPFDTLARFNAWMSQTCGEADPLFYAIVDPVTDKAVGVASYLRIDPRNGSIEVGHLNFSPRLQRTPAATEAMYLMMKHAFELGYRRYEWKCNALNAPSRTTAQRLGFSFEGVFRQAAVIKGRSRDTAWYAAIDSEWPELEKAFLHWLDASNFDPDGRQRTPLSAFTGPILKQRG